jgi:TolA-binding protein
MLPLFNPVNAAGVQEADLFEKAYEYYLSYHPEKALEYFDIFLEDFPGSSAKDAALFWKAKSLMYLKRTDEALGILSDIKQTFPESPFIPFVEKELSLYKSGSP